MQSRQPYRIVAAIVVALALSFAAGAQSASIYSTERANAETLVADFLDAAPFEYFPSRYQNQATEMEPLPPQF